MKLTSPDVAYIGDDESDIPCCSIIPFSFAVNDSHKDLKAISRFCLNKNGGDGVITEFIEKLNILNFSSKFWNHKFFAKIIIWLIFDLIPF